MPIRAVVFDIGGVLEVTPDTGWTQKWDARLNLSIEALDQRLKQMGRDGELGTCSEAEWQAGVRCITGMDQAQLDEFMRDLWADYLGTLNVELATYFSRLRPRYRTALLSNSFLGARAKEQERYQFESMTDLIIYSHEVGLKKPDKRIFELTCTRLGVQPQEMVFLDDFPPHVAAAQALGIQAVLFSETDQAIADVQTYLQAASMT
ncbi:MAG: HAD family phosphatase [Anaerolineae bacterium]|nr:HAD family phosphatase [Anaerolineae bacterium]